MERLVIFELRGSLAHFRRPDTLGTHASYPFLPRTTLRGLIASILGKEDLDAEDRCGLRLLRPVRTVAQQLSLHGKKWIGAGPNDSFHRPTSIELVIEPHYRIFYRGNQADVLAQRLENKQSHFHTYLGSAFCLTFPDWLGTKPGEPIPADAQRITCTTVVPSPAVAKLHFEKGEQYARVGGMLRDHIGERRFRGTVSVLYETACGPVSFQPAAPSDDAFWLFRQVPGEGTICLW